MAREGWSERKGAMEPRGTPIKGYGESEGRKRGERQRKRKMEGEEMGIPELRRREKQLLPTREVDGNGTSLDG